MNRASTAFGETMHGDFTAIVSEELFLRVQAEVAPGIPVAAMDVGVPQELRECYSLEPSRECYSGGGGGIRTLDTPGMSRML